MKKKFYYPYPHPAVTVDLVIFTIIQGKLKVLLIERGGEPYKGKLALPGGFVNINEDLHSAAARELEEETGVKGVFLEQLYTFGNVDRDPRERVITVAYYALVASDQKIEAGSDAKKVDWFDIDVKSNQLAFDHDKILKTALQRIQNKLEYTTIGFELVPKHFTLTQLQSVYEAILNKKLDKGNFHTKILKQGCVVSINKTTKELGLPYRPAALYMRKDEK